MKNSTFLSIIAILFSVFVFQSCEEDPVDPCEAVVCQNSGTCDAGVCDCPEGFSGVTCETSCTSSLIGVYNVTATNDAIVTVELKAGANPQELIVVVVLSFSAETVIDYTGTTSSNCTSITLDPHPEVQFEITTVSALHSGSITVNNNILTGSFVYRLGTATFTAEK